MCEVQLCHIMYQVQTRRGLESEEPQDTRAAILKDRQYFQLHLYRIDQVGIIGSHCSHLATKMAADVCRDHIKDVCRRLKLGEPGHIAHALDSLVAKAAAADDAHDFASRLGEMLQVGKLSPGSTPCNQMMLERVQVLVQDLKDAAEDVGLARRSAAACQATINKHRFHFIRPEVGVCM
jgi:hypothetical protein